MAAKEIGRGVGYNIGTDRGIIPSRFDTDFRELERSIKSSQTEGNYYGKTGKQGSSDGTVNQTVIIVDRGENVGQADRASQKALEAIDFRSGQTPDLSRTFYRIFEGSETFLGKEAKESVKKAVEGVGGKILKTIGDEVFYSYAVPEESVLKWKEEKKSPSKMFEGSLFREARKLSRTFAEEGENPESRMKDFSEGFSGKLKVVIAILALLADVARRILSAVIKDSAERREAAITARSVGVTGTEIRNWDNVERAKNLPEGTVLRAVSAIENKFGDVRHLDTEALAEIAPYMPENLMPLLQTGIAKENPKIVMEMLLDSALQQVASGLDWKNEYVGEDKARRSIVASMKRFDEDLGAVLENILDTNQYGVFAGSTPTFSAWENAGRDVFSNLTASQIAQYEELAQVTSQLSAQFTSLKDDVLTSFALSISGLFDKINQWDIGKTETEKLNDSIEARQRNIEASEKMSRGIQQAEAVFQGRADEIGLDFSSLGIEGVSTASEFFDYIDKDSYKAYDVIRSNPLLLEFLSDPDILMFAQMQKVMEERKARADRELSKKNVSDMEYDQLYYTDASIAGDVAKNLTSGVLKDGNGVVFQNWFKSNFLGNNYVSGGYSVQEMLSSQAAQDYAKATGINLEYSVLDTVDKVVEAGKEGIGANTRAYHALERLTELIEMRGGEKIKLRGWFGIPRSNEEIAGDIRRVLSENPSLLSKDDIARSSQEVKNTDINVSYEDWSTMEGAFLEDMQAEQEQKAMQFLAVAKEGALQAQLASLQKQGVDINEASLTLHTTSKDERDVTFVVEAVYNGKRYTSEGGTGKFESSSGRKGYTLRIPLDLSQME